jgi:hypothetical protein
MKKDNIIKKEVTINEGQIVERDFIVDKRVSMLQYINTGILTLILAIASMIAVTITDVKEQQANTQAELLRLKTIQDINVNNVGNLDNRVKTLEVNYTSELKMWVENNYVRKPQR